MNLDDFIITCFCLIDEMMPMIRERPTVASERTSSKAGG